MAMSDPVADMLTRIRNAAKAKFNSVDISGLSLKINSWQKKFMLDMIKMSI